MHYICLKSTAEIKSLYRKALGKTPNLCCMPVHNTLESAQAHLGDQGLIYMVDLKPQCIVYDPKLEHNVIRIWQNNYVREIRLFHHQRQVFVVTNYDKILTLNNLLERIECTINRAARAKPDDVTLKDYFTNLCCLIDEIRLIDSCSNTKLIRSLDILNLYLNRRLSYTDYVHGIKKLGLPSILDNIMRMMAISLLIFSLVICPSLLFTELLSSILVLNIMAISAMIGTGILFFPSPRQEYETCLTNLAKTHASIREQLSSLGCVLPPATSWR